MILAGGLGTRMSRVAPDTPKALIPVEGKPFIEHQLNLLHRCGLADILLCVGHLGDQIEKHVGSGARFGCNVSYSWEEPDRLLGTGGALVNAIPKLNGTFLLLYGDSYLPTDYASVLRAFDGMGTDVMMCVYRNEGKWDSSNVRIEGDRVQLYSKAARPGEADYIDYGLTVWQKSVVERYVESDMPLDLQRILGDEVDGRRLGAHVVTERFYEIGKPSGLEDMEAYLQKAED